MSHETRQTVKELELAYRLVKRLIDVMLGGVLLLLSLPIFLIAAVAIRLETKGNPFFLQKRIGLGGKPFTIVKLRGMYIDSRVRFAHLYDYKRHESLNFHFHAKEDPRITRVGAFIRRTSIDELPNFLNVVAGQMTLVGPRPEVPEMLELYGDNKAAYLSIKPGVTCVSKISGISARAVSSAGVKGVLASEPSTGRTLSATAVSSLRLRKRTLPSTLDSARASNSSN